MLRCSKSGTAISISTCGGTWEVRRKNLSLVAETEWPFANAVGQFAAIVRGFLSLKFFRKSFFRAGFADGGHRFDPESVGNFQLGPGAVVIEAFHSVNDEALTESLEREIFPGSAAIIGMSDRRFAVVFESLPRNEDDESGGIPGPGFVSFDEQPEECRPVLGAAARVESVPLLGVKGRGRPACGFEETE